MTKFSPVAQTPVADAGHAPVDFEVQPRSTFWWKLISGVSLLLLVAVVGGALAIRPALRGAVKDTAAKWSDSKAGAVREGVGFASIAGVMVICLVISQRAQARRLDRMASELRAVSAAGERQAAWGDLLDELNRKLDAIRAELRDTQSANPVSQEPALVSAASSPAVAPARASIADEDKVLLKALLQALATLGTETSSGRHQEVELRQVPAFLETPRRVEDLRESLARLNLIAADSPDKALREQNFLSLVSVRSRELVRVQKDALAGLKAFIS